MLQVADRWFERRQIDDDITRLWEPHVHSFLRCNIWHVRGRDRDMLVDTGMGLLSLKQTAKDLLGHAVTAVLTHTHMDHSGGAHEFDDLRMHQLEAASMLDGSQHLPLDTASWPAEFVEVMREHEPIGDYVITALPAANFNPDAHRLMNATATQQLNEGDVVDLGNRACEIIHLPGHSPGSIGLWEATTGTLFSGDAIYDGLLLDELEGSNIEHYIKTMERLMDLPVHVVYAGHEPSFDGDRLKTLAREYIDARS